MPDDTTPSIFCNRCAAAVPFRGLYNDNRQFQSVLCPPCSRALHTRQPKWPADSGKSRYCTLCATKMIAGRYARCHRCRSAPLPVAVAATALRSCDICAKTLPPYEQNRRVCYSCRRRMYGVRSRSPVPASTSTSALASAPAPLPTDTPSANSTQPTMLSSRFRAIRPAPATPSHVILSSATQGCVTTPLSGFRAIRPAPPIPGRLLLPSPRPGKPAIAGPAPRRCETCCVVLPPSLQRYRRCGRCRARAECSELKAGCSGL